MTTEVDSGLFSLLSNSAFQARRRREGLNLIRLTFERGAPFPCRAFPNGEILGRERRKAFVKKAARRRKAYAQRTEVRKKGREKRMANKIEQRKCCWFSSSAVLALVSHTVQLECATQDRGGKKFSFYLRANLFPAGPAGMIETTRLPAAAWTFFSLSIKRRNCWHLIVCHARCMMRDFLRSLCCCCSS